MDIRGPAEFNGKNNLHERRELTRVEPTQGANEPKSPKLLQPGATSELTELANRLAEIPEVRAEVVEKAVANIKDGTFAERQNAEKAAKAILDAFDGQ